MVLQQVLTTSKRPDTVGPYQELKIRLSTQPSCADGLILLSSNDFEYSECNAGLQAQQVVGPLISAC